MLTTVLFIAAATAAALLVAAGLLHVLGKVGLQALGDWFCRAPGLDVWIAYFTVAPLILGPVAVMTRHDLGAWATIALGLVAAIVGQAAALIIWTRLHELANRDAIKGPRLVIQINNSVGPFRNHLAVWWTAWAVPLFALVRLAQWLVYPPLTWLVRLPKHDTAEWVNVSRHKFSGLVGHDLIWCLYCDWMTGVWSLGTEMLRNVESFWCPIRFRSDKKCANCTIDFPDIDDGWAKEDGTMADAVKVHADHYPGPNGVNAWFGHPARLTVEGKPTESS